jgi:hypothetical protein
VQYGTEVLAAGNSNFYNTIFKKINNSSVFLKSSNIRHEKKNNHSLGVMSIPYYIPESEPANLSSAVAMFTN